MAEAIDGPEEMSLYAPRIISIKVPVDKIGEVIGPKGKVINQIQDDTGASLSIEDDGTIYIGASNGEAAEAARAAVNAIANPTMPEVGERYLGTVVKTTNFGAFVSLLPGKDGLLHITKLRALVGGKRVENVDDVVSVGQKIQVQIAEIDDRGKLSLIPVVEDARSRPATRPTTPRPTRRGRRVTHVVLTTTGRQPAAGRSSASQSGTTRTLIREDGGVDPSYRPAQRAAGHHRAGARRQRSATIGVWVGVGSRDESPALHGCSHFLEHLLFKGTEERSALDISIALDAVGGEFNAFTAKEYTCFHARVLDDDLPLAVDVLGDMVTGSLITPDDVEAERDVILDEIAMHDDDPDDVVHNLFAAQAWGDSPLGRPIAGTVESIEAMTREQVVRFYQRHYRPERHGRGRRRQRRPRGDGAPRCARRSAGRLPRPAPPSRSSAARSARARRVGAGVAEATRQFEQVNVVLGVNGLTRVDDRALRPRRAQRRARWRHVEPALPGGPREARAGLLRLLLRQPARRRRPGRGLGGLPARQARPGARRSSAPSSPRSPRAASPTRSWPAARVSCKGGLVLGLEDSGSRMTRIGKSELVDDELLSIDEVLARIDAVTLDDVRALAAQLFSQPEILAIVGPR